MALLALTLAQAAPDAASERWVIAVGANDGGSARERLRYAESDAQVVAEVLSALSPAEHTRVLSAAAPGPGEVLGLLRQAREAMAASPHTPREVVFYYSGHADGRGLLVGADVVAWSALRRAVGELPADVRVGIVDACAAGSLVRAKGGQHEAPIALDRRDLVRGEVWIASAAADESAQESDRLGASTFTHHLVSGLRGAADLDADGRVSLDEAYGWAYDQTLRTTERTWGGVQHPTYDMQLVGQGALILADTRARTARLRLADVLDGEVLVRDAAGKLVAELRKDGGVPLVWAMEPGRYVVRLRARDHLFAGEIDVREGAEALVSAASLSADARYERTRLRGDDVAWDRSTGFALHLAPPLSTAGLRSGLVRLRGLGIDVGGAHWADAQGLLLGTASWSRRDVHGMQANLLFAGVGRDLRGVQLSLVPLALRDVRGAQLTIGPAVALGGTRGLQLGLLTWTGGRLVGMQGGVVNLTRGRDAEVSSGLQLGVVNLGASGQRGAQVGLINGADRMAGVQAGLVNISREARGVQVGLINVARGGRPLTLGLLNITDEGYRAVELSTDDSSPFRLDLKTGGRVVYGVLALAADPTMAPVGFAWGLGMGAHAEHGLFVHDADFSFMVRAAPFAEAFGTSPDAMELRWRLQPGVSLAQRVDLFAGPAVVLDVRTREVRRSDLGSVLSPIGAAGRTAWWIGWTGGLRVRW